MLLNSNDYEDARQSRDARFDGRFFVGVMTTGIYCRPVCPVKIPLKKNVQLYPTAAAASAAGFRPCLRCRPESSPGTPDWSGSSWKVSKALQLIDNGYLDDATVEDLADELDVGARQLGRLFQEHIGASPIDVAQTRRLHFAKKLIDETNLPFSEICFAAGFGSIRRFNAVFIKTYNRSPKELRDSGKKRVVSQSSGISISLSYRPPFDWGAMLAFLAYRHIPGVEIVTDTTYSRSISIEGVTGDFKVEFSDSTNRLEVEINFPQSKHLYLIVDRIRSMFDLKADSEQIESFFSSTDELASMVKQHSGLRVPGCWDGFEVAVRAILGQQVTVAAATTLVGRIASKYGAEYSNSQNQLTHVFPEPVAIIAADLSGMGIVGQRIDAIKELAKLVESKELQIDCGSSTENFVNTFCSIKGIGEWTAYYVAMRALRDPDAFPYSDLILRRAATTPGETLTSKQVHVLSQKWKPWRAYSVILLWAHYGAVHKPVFDELKAAKTKIKKSKKKK